MLIPFFFSLIIFSSHPQSDCIRNYDKLKALLAPSYVGWHKTWVADQQFLPRRLITELHETFNTDNAIFLYVGNSITCCSLVMDSVWDEVPFISLLTDFDNSSKMIDSALNRIQRDKKQTFLQIFFEYLRNALPELKSLFKVSIAESPSLLHEMRGIPELVSCPQDVID